VTIGNIGEYSGAVGASLYTGQPMAQVVAKWLNAHCGLNGHRINIITVDDGSNPARYQQLAQQMVETQHVMAFMGNLVPLSATGAQAYLDGKGVPIIGGDGLMPVWFQDANMYYAGPDLASQVLGGGKIANQQGKTKVAVLYCGEAEPCRTAQQAWLSSAAAATGEQVVYTAQVSLAQPDFTSECLQAQSHGATALSLALDANSLQRLTRSCLQQGYHPVFLGFSLELTGSSAQDSDMNGMVATVPSFPFPANDLPGENDYHQAIRQYAPNIGDGSTATSEMWISGLELQAAGAHLSANPTLAELLNGLYNIKNETFGGLVAPTTFVKGQAGVHSPPCYFVLSIQGGKFVAPNGSKQTCS
jgi:branched-chain amino acid transport system substrate-binding protein